MRKHEGHERNIQEEMWKEEHSRKMEKLDIPPMEHACVLRNNRNGVAGVG